MVFEEKSDRHAKHRHGIIQGASVWSYLTVSATLAICAAASSQAQAPASKPPIAAATVSSEAMPAPASAVPAADVAESVEDQRVAQDRAKLLQLANDLKAEVDKSTSDTLSVNVIRKAAEIQRVARDLKEKMKYISRPN